MENIEVIVVSAIIIGCSIGLIMIFRDPKHFFKSTVRGLYNTNSISGKILFLPIWLPTLIFDKIFNLKIFISEMEDASKLKQIVPNDFEKLILVNIDSDRKLITILNEILITIEEYDVNYTLKYDDIQFSPYNGRFILKLNSEINLNKFNNLILYFSNADNNGRTINTKGILLNLQNLEKSFFYFSNPELSLKLVGKDYNNRKLYINLDTNVDNENKIYFNSNIDYFKNFNFDKLQKTYSRLEFKKLPVPNSTYM